MPQKPGSACKRSGCPGIVHAGVCSACGPLRRAQQQEYDARRGTSNERGYGYRWQQVRAMFLRSHPLCAECERAGRVAMATDVHHLVKRRDGGADSEDNLEALCHACHSAITARGG